MTENSYETSIDVIRQLFDFDNSQEFRFIIKLIDQTDMYEDLKNAKPTCFTGISEHFHNLVIRTTINKARAISSRVNASYQTDPLLDVLFINLNFNPICSSDTSMDQIDAKKFEQSIYKVFELLFKSLKEPVKIDPELNNLFSMIQRFLNSDEINHFPIASIKEAISLLPTTFYSDSIEYFASNLFDFFSYCSFEEIEEIVLIDVIDNYITKNEKNTDNDESTEMQIFKFLISRNETTALMHYLLQIDPRKYNDDMIDFLKSHIDDKTIDLERSSIARLLTKHFLPLLHSIFPQYHNVESYQYHQESELDGIMNHVGKSGGVFLSGGGDLNPQYPIINIIQYDPDHINDFYCNYYGRSAAESESWIQFDFGAAKAIKLSSYSIRSNAGSENDDFHPKSWRLCGSNDLSQWEVIDTRKDCDELNGVHKLAHFNCLWNDNKFRYIRYIQDNHWYVYYPYNICLTCIEFYGDVFNS